MKPKLKDAITDADVETENDFPDIYFSAGAPVKNKGGLVHQPAFMAASVMDKNGVVASYSRATILTQLQTFSHLPMPGRTRLSPAYARVAEVIGVGSEGADALKVDRALWCQLVKASYR